MLEKTTASCCPSIVYQLIGTKKMQQCLASSGVLEQYVPSPSPSLPPSFFPSFPVPFSLLLRFIEDSEMIRKMRSTFAGLYTLDKV